MKKLASVSFSTFLKAHARLSPDARIILSLGGRNKREIEASIAARISRAEEDVSSADRQFAVELREHNRVMALVRTQRSPEDKERETARYAVRVQELKKDSARTQNALQQELLNADANRDRLKMLLADWQRNDFTLPTMDPKDWERLGEGCYRRKTHIEYD